MPALIGVEEFLHLVARYRMAVELCADPTTSFRDVLVWEALAQQLAFEIDQWIFLYEREKLLWTATNTHTHISIEGQK